MTVHSEAEGRTLHNNLWSVSVPGSATKHGWTESKHSLQDELNFGLVDDRKFSFKVAYKLLAAIEQFLTG